MKGYTEKERGKGDHTDEVDKSDECCDLWRAAIKMNLSSVDFTATERSALSVHV